jgi:ribose 1,5-bisphosphokinase PhnN
MGMTRNRQEYVRVAFSDGYHYRWPVRGDVALTETIEEIRQAIVNTQWIVIPETGRSYSPHALVSVEVKQSSDDDPSAAERLGHRVREHVIDPINEPE